MPSRNWIIILTLVRGVGLGGCATGPSVLPDTFSNVIQAYDDGAHLNPPANIPADSSKRVTVPVNFEDAYRATIVSLTQAQMNIESEDKAGGVVFAQQIVQAVPGFQPTNNYNNQRSQERRYFLAIVLKEKEAELTEITAYARVQGRCYFIAQSFGLPNDRQNCQNYAAVHWATGIDSAQNNLSQFIILLRNNLIAAGVM
jgi:hypothetical protein